MYLGEPPFDRHGLAVRAGGHVAASQHAGKYVRCRVELGTQDIGESAFAGFVDGAGVVCDQPAQTKCPYRIVFSLRAWRQT
jgi:hypothetical protein